MKNRLKVSKKYLMILPIFLIFIMLISSSSAYTSTTVYTKSVGWKNYNMPTQCNFALTATSVSVEKKAEGSGGYGGLVGARLYGLNIDWGFLLHFFDKLQSVIFWVDISTDYASKSYRFNAFYADQYNYDPLIVGAQGDWLTISNTNPSVRISISFTVYYYDWQLFTPSVWHIYTYHYTTINF